MESQAPILVVGAGPVALATALALARGGLPVRIVGRPPLAPGPRTVALLEGSLRFLDGLGCGAALAAAGNPLARMEIVDDTPSLFRPPPVRFDAGEAGLPAFGLNVENHRLTALLWDACGAAAGIERIEARAAAFTFAQAEAAATLEDGRRVATPLVVAADGARSPAREAAGIGSRVRRYAQVALAAGFAHAAPHRDTSTEWHRRGGPFTLVPLPPAPGAPHRSSLVWLMAPAEARRVTALDDAAFAALVERQSGRTRGAMRLVAPRQTVPMLHMTAMRMVGARLALAGEAAHAFPPIGAQGLNLGLRDARDLASVLAAPGPADVGAPARLADYAARRASDVALRGLGVDLLNRALLDGGPASDFARGAGLLALGAVGPLRRLAMRAGLGPSLAGPGAVP